MWRFWTLVCFQSLDALPGIYSTGAAVFSRPFFCLLLIPQENQIPKITKKYLVKFDNILRVLEWTRREYFPTAPPFQRYSCFLKKLGRVIETQGAAGGIVWLKRRRVQYLKYLAFPEGSVEEAKYRTKLLNDLGHRGAALVLKKETPNIRMFLTALSALRSFSLPVQVDLSSITKASIAADGASWSKYIGPFWVQVMNDLSIPRKLPLWQAPHFSMKAGPNGPAITSSLTDLKAVFQADGLVEHLKIIGGESLHSTMNTLVENLPLICDNESTFFKAKDGGILRRLVGIPDREGKTRTIAILDYWSQEGLRPLHSHLFKILKTIPQDMTFNQGAFLDRVKSWGEGITLHSIDLTSATDRFPIDLIADVLGHKFGKKYSASWRAVMVDYPFKGPKDQYYKYSVGNPMGAQSSWSSFTLAHHFVMHWCCQELGIKWRKARYVILGDDVLIGDDRLAVLYREKLKILGVEVSENKTFSSPLICEFAKRYLYKGEEVSPFPISSLMDHFGDASLLVGSLTGETRKGLQPLSSIPKAIKSLSVAVGRSYGHSQNLANKAAVAQLTTEFIQGTVEAGDYIARLNHPQDEASQDFLQSITPHLISETCHRLVHEALLSGDKSFGILLSDEWKNVFKRFEAADRNDANVVLPLIPVLAVTRRFAFDFGKLSRQGLEGVYHGDFFEVETLSDFFVNPLSRRSWSLDPRRQKIQSWTKFSRVLRKVSREAIRSYDSGKVWSPKSFSPTYPHGEGLFFYLKRAFSGVGEGGKETPFLSQKSNAMKVWGFMEMGMNANLDVLFAPGAYLYMPMPS